MFDILQNKLKHILNICIYGFAYMNKQIGLLLLNENFATVIV